MKTAIKFGVYFFVTGTLITLVQYLISIDLLFRPVISTAISIGLAIIFMVLLLRQENTERAGQLSFGEGLLSTLVMYAVGSFLSILFAFVFYNYIDPSLVEKSAEYAQEIARKTAERVADMGGLSEVDKVEMLEEMEKQNANANPFTISGLLMSWAINLIFPGLILSLIISAIMKTKKSESGEGVAA